MIHSPHFRGYNRAASELTRGQPDWREQFDIGAERPACSLANARRAGSACRGRISGQRRCPRSNPHY
jgi:isopenicillin N synthase-like dioxygenase